MKILRLAIILIFLFLLAVPVFAEEPPEEPEEVGETGSCKLTFSSSGSICSAENKSVNLPTSVPLTATQIIGGLQLGVACDLALAVVLGNSDFRDNEYCFNSACSLGTRSGTVAEHAVVVSLEYKADEIPTIEGGGDVCNLFNDVGLLLFLAGATAGGGESVGEGSSGSGSGSGSSGADTTGDMTLVNPLGDQVTDIPVIIGKAIKAVMGIVGALALVVFAYGAFNWVTSAGSPERVKKGTNAILFAVVGLFIIFASYGILSSFFETLGL